MGLPRDFGTVLKGGRAGQKEAVRLFEIMELNPFYDRDNQTARPSTIIIAHLTGVAYSVKSVGVQRCK